MRFIADENLPGGVIRALREHGHDVLAVKESMRGKDDETVLARAQADGRVVVTLDKGFGELAYRAMLPASCGIVLFRLEGSDPDVDLVRMVEILVGRTDWAGGFTVVMETGMRRRRLPEAG